MALLEVARADEANGKDRGKLKKRLYGVHRVGALLEHVGELFWPVHAAAEEPSLDADGTWTTWVQGALDRRAELLRALSVPELPSADDAEPWAAYRWLHAEVIRLRLPAPALAGEADLRGLIWAELVAVAQILAADPVAGTETRPGQPRRPDAPLRQVIEGDADVARALLIYEIATQPLQTVSPRPPLPIALMRVSSAVRSPAADRLFGGRKLTAKTKLTGNEVMNFAAFYKASWRANDWMWGRLDTAAAMVNLLVHPDEVATRYGPEDISTLLTLIEAAVKLPPEESAFRQSGMDVGSWRARLNALWSSRKAAIKEELRDLFARGAAQQRLEVLRDTLSERRQLELLCTELPAVVEAATGDQLDVANRALDEAERNESLLVYTARAQVKAHERVSTPDKLEQLCAEYKVGSEELAGELGRARFTELLAQLLVVAWRAINASAKVPAFLRPIGVVLHSLRAAAVGVVRAPRWAVAGLPVVAVLALIAVWRGGLGPVGRTTAAAILVGVAVTVVVPVLRAPWLRAGAAALALAVGGFLGWRSWANRGVLRKQLDQFIVPTWLQGRPTVRLSWVALAVLAGLAVAALYARWSPAGRRDPSTSLRATVARLTALMLVAGTLVVLSYSFADTTDPWLAKHVNATSMAAVFAGAAASLIVAVALLIAARLSQSLFVAVLAGVLLFVLVARPPRSWAEGAGLAAALLVAAAIGGYEIYREARRAPDRRSSRRGILRIDLTGTGRDRSCASPRVAKRSANSGGTARQGRW